MIIKTRKAFHTREYNLDQDDLKNIIKSYLEEKHLDILSLNSDIKIEFLENGNLKLIDNFHTETEHIEMK